MRVLSRKFCSHAVRLFYTEIISLGLFDFVKINIDYALKQGISFFHIEYTKNVLTG